MLISIHVPKCAGTSFRQVLGTLFGAQVWFNYGTIFTREQAKPELVPPGVRIIHGHFLADAFDGVIPRRRLLTWVRHPVERVVSNYQHFLRSPDMRDDCCRALYERKLSLRGFADLDWMSNLTTRYLANKPVEDFEFVGIADCFPESIDRFCRTFGYRRPPKLPCENVNPARASEHYDISPADREFILMRNRADLAWYHQASERMASAGADGHSRTA
jgi:hypothetical protein